MDEIATITRGGNFQKKDFTEKGVSCTHYGQIYTGYGIYADKTLQHVSEKTAKKSKKAVTNDIIMAVTSENVEDVCKCVAWLGKEDITVSGHTAIIHHNQNAKYLAYYFMLRILKHKNGNWLTEQKLSRSRQTNWGIYLFRC